MQLHRWFAWIFFLPLLGLGPAADVRICLQAFAAVDGCCDVGERSSCCPGDDDSQAELAAPCDGCCIHVDGQHYASVAEISRAPAALLFVSTIDFFPEPAPAAYFSVARRDPPPKFPGRTTPRPLRI